jgi:hypothetical protein
MQFARTFLNGNTTAAPPLQLIALARFSFGDIRSLSVPVLQNFLREFDIHFNGIQLESGKIRKDFAPIIGGVFI